MNTSDHPQQPAQQSRRDFLKTGTVAVLAAQAAVTKSVFAAGSDTIRLGLVGCGGRGTGAAVQALTADPGTTLVALGDVFADQLDKSLNNLQRSPVKDRVQVDSDHQFVGFDAYKGVIDSVDLVLLATPPHFRPLHIRAAIEAGKHVFAEKPVAVDAPGVRSVLETAELARDRNVTLFCGLQWRYETNMIETVRRIHDGQIGEIRALESTRYAAGVGKLAKRQPEWSDMEYQMRNWYYFTWLSGDFIVEQFVHEIDKMAWVMQDEYPISCIATGGRQTRTAPEYGHIYDHFNAIFEYADGTKLYAGTRHQPGCTNESRDIVHGTTGRADLMKFTLTGEKPWKGPRQRTVMHQLEHDALFAGLRDGKIFNHGHYMANSTLMAIMARDSAYTGKMLTWQQMLNSQRDLSPPAYDWNIALPDPPIAMPGITPFV